jgi:Circularly permutated YpsA SLOG family
VLETRGERHSSYTVVRKIISGGQTGADRAGLDFAIEVGLAHGGYVAKGRKAEDGRIDEKYRLTELATNSYPERTKRNVRQSDGTIILSLNEKLSGGSALTLSYARHANKPVLHIHNSETGHDPLSHQVRRLKDFIESNAIEVLNLAGPRESNEPGVYRFTLQLLRQYWQQYRA